MRITEILNPQEHLELMQLINCSIAQQLSRKDTATKQARTHAKVKRKTGLIKTDVMRRYTKI